MYFLLCIALEVWFRHLCVVKFGEHVMYFAHSLHFGLVASNIVFTSFLSISPLKGHNNSAWSPAPGHHIEYDGAWSPAPSHYNGS